MQHDMRVAAHKVDAVLQYTQDFAFNDLLHKTSDTYNLVLISDKTELWSEITLIFSQKACDRFRFISPLIQKQPVLINE